MITKEKLKTHIDKFPDEMSIDELIDRLVFVDKLERRLEQSKKDETINEQDLEKEVSGWFK